MEPSKGLVLLAGNSHKDFAELVAQHLNVSLGKVNVYFYSNRETAVDIYETLRGRDVYIIQTGTKSVNNDIMELLIMIYGCKTSCARSITVAMPYMPYCKQSKMRKRGSIVSQLMAKMLCKAGMNQVITMDLHAKEIQGFFDVPVDNLRASPFLIKYVEECIPDYRNAVIVARNPNAVHRATSYAERLRLPLAVIHGEEQSDSENTDGRNSPPMGDEKKLSEVARPSTTSETRTKKHKLSSRTHKESLHVGFDMLPMMLAKEKPPLTVVGDVSGHIAIIIDDIIDDVDQFVTAAELLHERGVYKVFVMATHGLLSSDAPRKLEDSLIDEIIVTNTVPHHIQKMQCHKIKTVDVTMLIAEAIRRIHNNESMSYLFMNIPKDD